MCLENQSQFFKKDELFLQMWNLLKKSKEKGQLFTSQMK